MRALVTLFVVLSNFSAAHAADSCTVADQLADKSVQFFAEYERLSAVSEYLKTRVQNDQDKYYQNPIVLDLANDAESESNRKSAEANELAKKALKIYRTNSCK